jgi:hypothetical protein
VRSFVRQFYQKVYIWAEITYIIYVIWHVNKKLWVLATFLASSTNCYASGFVIETQFVNYASRETFQGAEGGPSEWLMRKERGINEPAIPGEEKRMADHESFIVFWEVKQCPWRFLI